jgi:hypothetical protein
MILQELKEDECSVKPMVSDIDILDAIEAKESDSVDSSNFIF